MSLSSPRRSVFSAILGFALALTSSYALAAISDPQADDMSLGRPKAPVTVTEYASVGCPHCAAWANDNFAAFKTRFIDSGKVRFVMRELLTGDGTVATAGFMLARCAGPDKYFEVVDGIFKRQASMYAPGASRGDILADIARSAGMDDQAISDCIHSTAGLDAFNARNLRHGNQDGVTSTPTFFVGDQRMDGEPSLDEFAKAIDAARHKH